MFYSGCINFSVLMIPDHLSQHGKAELGKPCSHAKTDNTVSVAYALIIPLVTDSLVHTHQTDDS